MDDDPEVIRHQMEATRSSLTDKIERLEQTVTKKVDAVTGTVQNVRGAVRDTVDTVKESVETVKETFDVRRYFREYPWAAFGVSVGAGFAGGMALGSGARARGDRITGLRSRGQPFRAAPPSYNGGERRQTDGSYTVSPAHGAPSWAGELSSRFGGEIEKLKGLAVGAIFGLVRDWIGRGAPGDVGRRVAEVIDDVTRKLGGEPIRGNLLDTFTHITGGKSSRERETASEARIGQRTTAEPEF